MYSYTERSFQSDTSVQRGHHTCSIVAYPPRIMSPDARCLWLPTVCEPTQASRARTDPRILALARRPPRVYLRNRTALLPGKRRGRRHPGRPIRRLRAASQGSSKRERAPGLSRHVRCSRAQPGVAVCQPGTSREYADSARRTHAASNRVFTACHASRMPMATVTPAPRSVPIAVSFVRGGPAKLSAEVDVSTVIQPVKFWMARSHPPVVPCLRERPHGLQYNTHIRTSYIL